MGALDVTNIVAILEQIRARAAAENIRITQHAQHEMVEEDITLDEVLQAIATGNIVENYPEHRRGACCLLNGHTQQGRSLHTVCTTAQRLGFAQKPPVLIIITAYEPKPPKWVTPTQRRR